jgi:integrase/recombinase XerD
MKKKIALRRIFHRERWRYGVFFNFDSQLASLARKVPGSLYSDTFKCWYVDDNEDNLKRILTIFHEYADIDISQISSSTGESKLNATPCTDKVVNTIQVIDRNQTEYGPRLRDYGIPPPLSRKKTESSDSWKRYGPVEFTIDEADDKLIVKFIGRYDPVWIKELRSFGRAWFDPHRLEWVLDWSRLTVDSLSDYFSERGIEVIVRRNDVSPLIKDSREEKGAEIRDRILGGATLEGMENVRRYLVERRYSLSTVEAYNSLLGLFFKYFLPKSASEITEDDISDFFHDYVIFHNYSASYQNQIISAVKIYYKLNGPAIVDTSALGRPRRRRALPKVFSKDEVKGILVSTRNIKHRLLLWMIYSCGLRRSEVTNIKVNDLDRERGILNIREAKGKVDRIVPVSGKVWDKIDEYFESYHPVFWLFEGQTGGRYSSESVYRVFKQALKSAGIKKEVGVHSLRHSYATHLHENGLDIRYIQELLGHKSTRTTEIYTHVSRRNLIAVRSPIEDIDVK